MLDLKLLRKDPENIEKKLKTKNPKISLKPILELDQQYRELLKEQEQLQSMRNNISKEIGQKKQAKEDAEELMQKMQGINEKLQKIQKDLPQIENKRNEALAHLPNLPDVTIKISPDPKDNVCIKEFGKKKSFSFPFKNHIELNEKLFLFDFKASSKLSGSNWPLYRNMGARLEWALLNYMLDIHIKNGFTLILPPLMVQQNIMYGSGQLPKFEDQLYKIKDEDFSLYLIPTAEVALNGIHQEEIFKEESLPKKYVSYTPCFRREAGAAGKQERGLIRMHQFNKVELFCFSLPKDSPKIFDQMIESAEEVLEGLELHYRNMLLVTGDTSFSAAKTVDIEVWLPGQDRYYEVSSVSNCTDFQARRSLIRYKSKQNNKPELIHTLNGSGVATSRLMVALLENNQKEDGSIEIPRVLHKYLEEEITTLKPNA